MAVVCLSNLRKLWFYLQKNGIKETWRALCERLGESRQASYFYAPPAQEVLRAQRETAVSTIRLSVVVPAFETLPAHLTALLSSLQNQTYPHWELILADAGRTDTVYRTARQFAAKNGLFWDEAKKGEASGWIDGAVRYRKLKENRGISENTNAGIDCASGAYVGLLDHDDLLTPDALYETASAVEAGRAAGKRPLVLYSDEDKCDEKGLRFYEPHLKCGFNPDLLLSNNYICHFLVMDRELIRRLRLRRDFDGAQDYDLVLRAMAEKAPFSHIPKVLYHWRCHEASTAQNPRSKAYAYEAGKRAVEAFCKEAGWQVAVSGLKHLGFYRVDYKGDLFAQRGDVGALAGPLPAKKEFRSGIYEPDGSMRFAGLKKGFSGPLHRAALQQDVEAADLRGMRVRKELEPLYDRAMEQIRRGNQEEADFVDESVRFCREIRQKGYRILWDPQKDRIS